MIRRRSYLSLGVHIVWSTKERHPLITPDIEPRLYDFFRGIARRRGCDILAIGGTENHVHLLLVLPATIRPCDLIRELKAGSSRLIQETLKPDTWFDWQDNYALIAVSPSHRRRLIAYVNNQKQHHADGTTQELYEIDSELYETEPDASSEG
jgi:REP element-mobilizing transposase RayT